MKRIPCFFLFSLLLCNNIQAHEFPYKPPKPIQLMQGLGNLHHPVTTKSPEAQKFFDQGFTLIYAFNHDAAYWSFLRASELDPDMAMAYWGMALALGANINMDVTHDREKKAFELVQKALSLSGPVTENEKDYIKALSTRYSNDQNPNFKQLTIDYNEAMKALHIKYPDDLDAATLYAESGLDLNPWHQWTPAGDPLKGTLDLVHTLEEAIKWDPNHLGANHYYIHVVEASRHPEYALMSAERLSKMLPASGHILHMPSHIYLLVGDYQKAVESNLDAIKADQAYIDEFGTDGIYPVHYMSHNIYFLARAYSLQGRFEDAKKTAEKLRNFYAPHFSSMPELEYYETSVMFILLRFHHWKDLLNLPAPQEKMAVSRVLWHFGRAMAFSALHDERNAEIEQNLFLESKDKIPADTVYGYNKAVDIFKVAEFQLNAKIDEMRGDISSAIMGLRSAINLQDNLYYNEPPDWYFPIRESLGGLLLRNKQYREAEVVLRGDLEKHPLNGRSLFGLWLSLVAQSKPTDAFWIKREFDEAWKYSDTQLTIDDL
jgi:tetratricopeptide (TPR) repeat protein